MSDLPLYILVLLLLVPLSGFIAWAGDRIGHRIGKRRQSFLGLRPRHTATVFTIGAGIGIALVSFGLLLLSDARLRLVLSEGTRLLTQNKELRAQNSRLTTERSSLDGQIAEARAATKAADAARSRAEKARANAEKERRGAETRLRAAAEAEKQAQKALAGARTSLASARTDLKGARQRVAEAQARLADARQQVRGARKDLSAARKQEQVAREKFDGAQRSFNALADYQLELKGKLAEQESALENQKARYAAQTAQMQKALADQRLAYENETRRQKADLDGLKNEIARLEVRRDEMDRLLGLSLNSTTNLRRSPITYQIGEEVDRLAIPAGTNIWRVQDALTSLLASAGRKAETRGAGRGGGPRAVTLVPRPMPGEPAATAAAAVAPDHNDGPPSALPPAADGGGEPLLPTEDDALRISAAAIRRANEEVVVILTAATNAVVGEPVPVTLRTYRNPVVFPEGATVGQTTLDGSGDRQAVADSVYAFLRQDVRKRLLEAGVIPAALGGNPEDDSDESVVNLSGSEWLKVLDDVRRAGPRARLTVKAARELRAADPVSLRFEVKSLPVPYPSTASSR